MALLTILLYLTGSLLTAFFAWLTVEQVMRQRLCKKNPQHWLPKTLYNGKYVRLTLCGGRRWSFASHVWRLGPFHVTFVRQLLKHSAPLDTYKLALERKRALR